MFRFHYDIMRPVFDNKLEICFTDTDSLLYVIQLSNISKTLEKIKDWMDFSNYPETHSLYSDINKNVPGR